MIRFITGRSSKKKIQKHSEGFIIRLRKTEYAIVMLTLSGKHSSHRQHINEIGFGSYWIIALDSLAFTKL